MSKKNWRNTVERVSRYYVSGLAEKSCEAVRMNIKHHGDHRNYDGFYLTRGHHSNNMRVARLHGLSIA